MPQSQERQAGHLQVPSQVRPTDHEESTEVCDVATSADQPKGMRGDGEPDGDGVGQLLPAHERQPSLPRVAAFRQHALSPVLDPEKQRPGFRMETLSEQQAVCNGARLHWQRHARVHGATCAWCAQKTVGPPYSGTLNVRWDGKGMVTRL